MGFFVEIDGRPVTWRLAGRGLLPVCREEPSGRRRRDDSQGHSPREL